MIFDVIHAFLIENDSATMIFAARRCPKRVLDLPGGSDIDYDPIMGSINRFDPHYDRSTRLKRTPFPRVQQLFLPHFETCGKKIALVLDAFDRPNTSKMKVSKKCICENDQSRGPIDSFPTIGSYRKIDQKNYLPGRNVNITGIVIFGGQILPVSCQSSERGSDT